MAIGFGRVRALSAVARAGNGNHRGVKTVGCTEDAADVAQVFGVLESNGCVTTAVVVWIG